ncbi:hypothetical protein L1080_023325 [Rhodococcus sp. MSC1_016]|jgi:hypothetical protein|uniref:hypothetical protein n=1 Tax=Rhodococcus sp. MSC1_016 TaxID=2909266 RepID=UPI00202DB85E|nr:hypothetical protein [Rhodococcus sp. MSC1_016]
MTVDLRTIPGVELVKAGTWDASTGKCEITRERLASMKAAHDSGRFHKPPIKLGHLDARFDGEPSLGIVDNLTLTDEGDTLVGDLVGVPAWLAEIAPSAYPNRSIEALFNLKLDDGTTYPGLLTGLALLGVVDPACKTIASLEDVRDLYQVAASAGTPVVIATRTAERVSTLHTLPPRERVKVRVAAARRRHRTAEHLLTALIEGDPK